MNKEPHGLLQYLSGTGYRRFVDILRIHWLPIWERAALDFFKLRDNRLLINLRAGSTETSFFHSDVAAFFNTLDDVTPYRMVRNAASSSIAYVDFDTTHYGFIYVYE